MNSVSNVSIIGAGFTGKQIAEWTVLHNFKVSIFDIKGKLVKNVKSKHALSGRHSMDLNEYLTVSGIYLVFIRVNGVISWISGRTVTK